MEPANPITNTELVLEPESPDNYRSDGSCKERMVTVARYILEARLIYPSLTVCC